MISKRVIFVLLLCAFPLLAQTKHGRIQSEGQSTFDEFSNTQTVALVGATPSVAGGNVFRTANGLSTTITNFPGATDSQEITVVCGETLTTIQNNANIVISTGADFPCISIGLTAKFVYSLTDGKWFQISGGGGGSSITPPGSNGDLPLKNGSLFGASHINDDGARLLFNLNESHKGPNPYFDILAYGGYFESVIAPATSVCSITASSTTLSCVSNTSFLNGHGVVIPKAGLLPLTRNASFPAVPTVATVTPIGVSNGSTTYSYQFVLEDYFGGLTAAGTAGTTTTGAATLGVNTVSLTGMTRVSGLDTFACSANCNVTTNAQVQIAGATGGANSTVNGTVVVNSIVDPTHFTVFANGMPDYSESFSGTLSVKACNELFPVGLLTQESVIMRTWIYRGGTLVGVSPGQDPFFIDCGQGVSGQPAYVPTSAPGAAQAGYLSTTIDAGGGTTSMTVHNAAGTTATSQTVQHSNDAALIAAYTAALAAHGGVVRIPVIPAGGTNTFPFNASTNLSTVSNPTNATVRLELAAVTVNQPWILPNFFAMEGIPQVSTSFQYSPLASIAGNSHPFILGSGGAAGSNGVRLSNVKFVTNNATGQSSIVLDQRVGGGGEVGWVFNDVALAGNFAPAIVIKGGFDFWFTRGVCGLSDVAAWATHPCIYLTNASTYLSATGTQAPGRVYIDQYNLNNGVGIQLDNAPLSNQPGTSTSGGGDIFLTRILHESNAGPTLRVAMGLSTTSALASVFVLDGVNFADNANGAHQPLLELTGNANIHNITVRNSQGSAFEPTILGGGTTASSLCINNLFTQGCGPTPNQNINGVNSVNDGGVIGSINGGSIGYLMSTPAAPASCVVSAGGSVPISAVVTYGIIAVDRNNISFNPFQGLTLLGPTCSVTTSSGQQTVTVTHPTLPSGAIGWLPFRGFGSSLALANIVGCGTTPLPVSTTTFVDTFATACGQSAPQANTAFTAGINSGGINTGSLTLSSTTVMGIQGTDTKLLSAGTVSGTSIFLCTTALGGATTVGCPSAALTTNSLSQFASTTSAQLAGVVSDETGSGALAFATSPALVTPTVSTSLTINAGGELDITTTGGKVGIKAPASVSADHVWALPDHDSTGTQCISSNGSHILSFSACSGGTGTPGGSDTNVQYRSGGTFTGSPAFTYDGTSTVSIGNTSGGTLGHLAMIGSTSGTVTIQSQTTAGTPTLTLPNTSGTFATTATAPITIDAITGTVACLSCATASGTLTSNQLLIGQNGNVAATLGSLGTTTTVLHGNASGAPSFGPVSLTADVAGILPYANGGTAQPSRQAAINALLGATTRGQLFTVDASLNVVPLTLGSNGSCLTATATDPAWGSCATGAVSGTASAGQVTTWGTTSSITGNPNFTYSGNLLTLLQGANGASTQVWKRFTDASPTGNAWEVKNASGATIANMDVNGNLTAVSLTTTGPCNGGTAGCDIFQQGTAPTITSTGAATLYGPASITDYRMALPAGPGTGVLRGSNSSGTVTLSFVSASGVGTCTNQVVTAVNDNALPTCGPVVGPMFGTQAANLVLKGPNSGAAAFPTFAALVSADIPPINLNTNGANGGVTAILPYTNGGCNASSASACFNGIYPGTTAGDIVYEVSPGVAGRLAAGTSSQVLIGGTAPSWGALNLASMTTGTLGISSGGSGQVTANAALNAFLPSQGGNAGNCLGTNGTNSSWITCGSGGAGVTPHPNFGTSFSSQTSVTIAGSSHLMGTKNLGVFCYDNASPAKALIPANWTVNGSTFDVVVTFAASQSGYCVVNGSGPNRYATSFSGVTTVTVTGATHALATSDLNVAVWDNSSPRKQIIPASVTVDTSTFDVVVTFAVNQSGRLVIQ